MSVKVGIDLGTTYSAVARLDLETGKPVIIKNSKNKSVTPSVLYFEEDGTVMFGEDAQEMLKLGDGNGVSMFKRDMGNDNYHVIIRGKKNDAVDFSAILLDKIKRDAEAKIGEKIDSAVITVPAYFSHKEREATIRAGEKAGLNVIAIINEPTSAAFAYGLNLKGTGGTILVYDLGGGTFDVSIAKIKNDEIEILCTDGNHQLGGKDWDRRIMEYISKSFKDKHDEDTLIDDSFAEQFLLSAESAKRQLSDLDAVNVRVQYGKTVENIELSNTAFEEITRDLMSITKDLTEKVIAEAGLLWRDIDGVILVGGSTRMKMVRKFVREMSGKESLSGVNVDEAVALGAAVRANLPPTDQIGGRDEYAQALIGDIKLTDVTAHSLGMIAENSDRSKYVNDIIIRKNSKIPAENKREYELRSKEMEVYVLQGENPEPLNNTLLYKYVITGIELNSSSPAKIGVTYQYDSNGVVNVVAEQSDNGRQLTVKKEQMPEDMSWASMPPKEQKAATPNIEIVLAVDLSGSMTGEPLKNAQKAMTDFLGKFDGNYTKIAVLGFSDNCQWYSKLSSDFSKVRSAINNLTIGNALGYGNDAEPFSDAKSLLTQNISDNTVRYIVCLTDGVWSNKYTAIDHAKECHSANIEVISLGFGSADKNFLKAIASVEDFASFTNSSADLGGSFSKIARVISGGAAGIKDI